MYTADNTTKASLPGQLTVSRKRFLEYYGDEHGPRFLLRASTFVPFWLANSTGIMYERTFLWTRTKEQMIYGCLCPSMVVDRRAGLMATFANLNAGGEGSVPAIRITRERLDMIPAEKTGNGHRLASASVFYRTEASMALGQWSDFGPLAIDALVDDRSACDSAFSRLSRLAWQALEMGMAQLPERAEVGLYYVDVPHEITWNAF